MYDELYNKTKVIIRKNACMKCYKKEATLLRNRCLWCRFRAMTPRDKKRNELPT